MSKREYCNSHDSIAYYSGLNGIEIKGVEYGITDFIYCVSGAWGEKKSYHKTKVYYSKNGDYFKIHGYRIPLNECIKM